MSEEANAGSRKATGTHNRPDTASGPTRKGADFGQVNGRRPLSSIVVQETGEKATVSPEQTGCDWNSIDWAGATVFVRKLRQEIFRAAKANDLKKVRTLQRIMLRSYENRILAVRRVTQ